MISFLFLFWECKKDNEIITPGELTANELVSVTKENNINLVSIYITEYYNGLPYLIQKIDKERFTIEDAFLIVNQQYYNLERLQRFELITNDSVNYAQLYFSN